MMRAESRPTLPDHGWIRPAAIFDGSRLLRALDRDDAVVHLARQQAERKADHAARMGGQALDRQMGFAGVGGAKDSLDRVGGVGRHFLGCNAGTGGAAAQQRIDEGGSITPSI